MPRVVLIQPFMKHYGGSVFDLDDAVGMDDWNENELAREKQSFISKQYYFLPDDGNGRPTNLLLSNTVECPSNIFKGIELTSGPCRITSLISGDKQYNTYAEPNICNEELKCRINLNVDSFPKKNYIEVSVSFESIDVYFINLIDQQIEPLAIFDRTTSKIDFSNCLPGFYRVDIHDGKTIRFSFTVIKCYPLIVSYDKTKRKCSTTQTIW